MLKSNGGVLKQRLCNTNIILMQTDGAVPPFEHDITREERYDYFLDRIRNILTIIDFPTTFVPVPTKTGEAESDRSLLQNVNKGKYKEPFRSILEYHHKTYKLEDLYLPKRFKYVIEFYITGGDSCDPDKL